MFKLADYYIKKTNNKEEAQQRQASRKQVEVQWRRDLRHVIDEYEAATTATIAGFLGINPNPTTAHERTQLRQLRHRLERNAFHGRFRVQYEYTVDQHGDNVPKTRQKKYAGRVWYISNTVSRRDGYQYEHKGLIGHLRATLDKLDGWELLMTDAELRDAKPPLVYDLYGKLNGKRVAFEINLSKHPKFIAKRCQLWKRYMDDERRDFPFKAERYLWLVETEEKARNIHDAWIKAGVTTGQFWVTWESQFTPFTPATILGDIWLRADSPDLQKL